MFRSEHGNPIQASTWWQVWEKVRAAALDAEQLGPLMAGPTTCGTRCHPAAQRAHAAGAVAAWAGHSVEVLTRIYTHVITGQEDVLIAQMDAYRRRS